MFNICVVPQMPDTLATKLSGSALKATLLAVVAAEDIDHIPEDLDDSARFVISAVRAVAHRAEACSLCAFVFSAAPSADGKALGFNRIAHMQEGHGNLENMIVLTSRDANNGFSRSAMHVSIAEMMTELEELSFDNRLTVFWDGAARVATVYPEGIAKESHHARFSVPLSDNDLTQSEVCTALDIAYNDNLKNPSGGTAHLWSKGKLIRTAEDEIERHLKGQLALYFAGQKRAIRLLRQTNTDAGRTDLIFIQKPLVGNPRLSGVLELKVLRGPPASDWAVTTEGLSQGYHYRNAVELPFATLALYDVSDAPSTDTSSLLEGQDATHVAMVLTRRFPIFGSPKEWRDAQQAA
jgi:hypothetical protein